MNALLTAKEVSALLGVSHKTVLSWAELDKIPHYKFGQGKKSPVRFDPSEIENWMRTYKSGPVMGYTENAEIVVGALKERKVKK